MIRALTFAAVSIIASGLMHAEPVVKGDPASPSTVISEAVTRQLAAAPEARVVILLDTNDVDRRDTGRYRAEIARRQEGVLRAFGPNEFKSRHRLQSIPLISGELRAAGLARLRHMPGVLRVDLEQPGAGDLAQSVPLIHADNVQSLGYTGAGMTVAVIDSGIDTDHVDLADAVDGQVCFCTGGCCPNGSSSQIGPGAAEDDHSHGTHVSGIVTSNGLVAPRGVAPDAKIVAVKVLDENNRTCCMSDVLAGLDWVLVNRPDVDAVNISIGSSALYAGTCDGVDSTTLGFARVLGDLRERGGLTFVSAGNNASGASMTMPACVSGAVAVGAVWDSNVGGGWNFGVCTDAVTAADQVTCFSNSDAATDIFGPGAPITSTVRGGGTAVFFGTSMASPHGAGCAAALLQATPGLSAAALEAALKATGVPVTDPKNGLTFPRIDCLAALLTRSCPDADGDGFWIPVGANCPDGPYVDCDDTDATRYPGNTEICDGQDDNCNGSVDEGFDPDGDGVASCFDNCPDHDDPVLADRDSDGEGDACDLNDGYIELRMRADPITLLSWQPEEAWPLFNLYRGSLNALADTDDDGVADHYGTCSIEGVPGNSSYVDPDLPAVGDGYFYLVRGMNGGVEGPLGVASNGAPRLNATTCAEVYGVAPVIESVTVTMAGESVSCDFTTICETWLCSFGVPDVEASPLISVFSPYSRLRVEARVTDADSTPGQSEIREVLVELMYPNGGGSFNGMWLLDDGSLTPLPEPQRSDVAEDCSGTGCVCSSQTYLLNSGDAVGSDSTYTRVVGLARENLPRLMTLTQDCLMRQAMLPPIVSPAGLNIGVRVTARDYGGHEVISPETPAGTATSAFGSCGGDACGCCLMTSGNPGLECSGLAGMISPDYPAGFCTSF